MYIRRVGAYDTIFIWKRYAYRIIIFVTRVHLLRRKSRVSANRWTARADKFYHTEPLPSFIQSYRSCRPRPRCTVRKNGRVNLQHMRKFRTSDARGRMVRANAVAFWLRWDFASRKGVSETKRRAIAPRRITIVRAISPSGI